MRCPDCQEGNDSDAGRCTACGRTFTLEMGAADTLVDAPTRVSDSVGSVDADTLVTAGAGIAAPRDADEEEEEPTLVASSGVRRATSDEPTRVAPARTIDDAGCPTCGTPSEPSWRFCKRCGGRLADGSRDAPRHRFVEMRTDGAPTGREHEMTDAALVVGRSLGDVVLGHDAALSGTHASFELDEGRVHVRDLDSTNGTFVEARAFEPLAPGDVILIGSHRLLYRRRDGGSEDERELAHVAPGGRIRAVHPLDRTPRVVGCGEVDLALPKAPGCARRHAEIAWTGDSHSVRGLSPRARTWISIRGRRVLEDGALVRLGDRTILEYRRSARD